MWVAKLRIYYIYFFQWKISAFGNRLLCSSIITDVNHRKITIFCKKKS